MKITTKTEALNIVETSYLASLSSFIMGALYICQLERFIKIDFTSPNDTVAFEKRN